MKGKKKHHEEEHVDETWLLPYSDMLTLLLALFIVMFAMSKVDSQKMIKLSQEFNVIFAGGSSVVNNGNGSGKSLVSISNNTKDSKASQAEKTGQLAEQDKMIQIKNNLQQEIDKSGYSDKINLDLNLEGLDITIQDTVLFNSGEADILKNFDTLLVKISSMVKGLDNQIRVSGYTDNVPISNSKFRDNWDLSYMRASNVMNFMSKSGISPERFSIQAYGEYKAKYDNSTEEGRAKNRKVEILIVRKYPLSTDSGK